MRGNYIKKQDILYVNNKINIYKVPIITPKGEKLSIDPLVV